MQKTRRFFSKLTAAVLAGAMLVSGGAVSMTVSAASAKPVLNTDVTVPSAGNVLIGMEGTYANDIKAGFFCAAVGDAGKVRAEPDDPSGG